MTRHSGRWISYLSVSTDRQGAFGLGLEAQRRAVADYLNGSWTLAAEYLEIESGKRHVNRPQLAAALAACKKHKARLIVAKLDRLARNVAFISTLMEAGVEFVACDMPHANKLTIHILAGGLSIGPHRLGSSLSAMRMLPALLASSIGHEPADSPAGSAHARPHAARTRGARPAAAR
jgi:hypothetical protein